MELWPWRSAMLLFLFVASGLGATSTLQAWRSVARHVLDAMGPRGVRRPELPAAADDSSGAVVASSVPQPRTGCSCHGLGCADSHRIRLRLRTLAGMEALAGTVDGWWLKLALPLTYMEAVILDALHLNTGVRGAVWSDFAWARYSKIPSPPRLHLHA